jgi:hypothetical protein
MAPTSQMRALRELEEPSTTEGFAAVKRVAFERAPWAARSAGVFVAGAAVGADGWQEAVAGAAPSAPHLVFDWGAHDLGPHTALLQAEVAGPVEAMMCPHGGGPPACWCRPPLPGLPLSFARAHDVDPARSWLLGSSPVHRNLAAAIGAWFVQL